MASEVSDQDIDTIRDWVKTQPHFPKVDDLMIRRFLFSCKTIERTQKIMDSFFKLRAEAPEFFTNRDPEQESIQRMFKLIDTLLLPNRTKEGYQLYLHRVADQDTEYFDFVTYCKAFFLISDTRFNSEKDIPNGDIPCFDMSGFTFKHLTKLMLAVGAFKKYMQITQDTHPVRLKQVHILNTSSMVSKIMAFVKPFMKSEVRNALHFHTNMDSFFEFVSPDVVPVEYGGTGGTIKEIRDMTHKRVAEQREWLMTNPWMSDESKRPGKKNSTPKIMNGSFKTLSLD